jgi:hypothetical protein
VEMQESPWAASRRFIKDAKAAIRLGWSLANTGKDSMPLRIG